MAVLHKVLVSEVLSKVRAKIESKSSKSYGKDFALIVGFNDGYLDPADADEFEKLNMEVQHSFSEVYLVGIHGHILVPRKEVAPDPQQ